MPTEKSEVLVLRIWSGQPGSAAGELLSCQGAISYIAWTKQAWHSLLTLLHVCSQGRSTAKGHRFEVFPLGCHKNQQLTFTTLYKLFILQDVQSLFGCHTEGTLVNVAAFVRMWELKVRL